MADGTPAAGDGPAPPRRGGRPRTRRKQELVDVAKRLFAERGVRQTTVRDIGASGGILSGSLYHHFGSKDDLVDYILRDFAAEVLARYDEIAALDASSADKLRLMTRYAFSLLATAPDEMIILLDEYLYAPGPDGSPSRFGYLTDFNARIGRHWFDVLESGVASGQFGRSVEPRMLYRLIRDAIVGATRWWKPTKDMTTDDVADWMVDTVLTGIVRRD